VRPPVPAPCETCGAMLGPWELTGRSTCLRCGPSWKRTESADAKILTVLELGAALHLGHPATHSTSAIHATSDHHGVANARGAAVLLGRPKPLWAIPPWAHPRCARFGNGCGCRPPRGRRVPPEPSLPPRCAAPGRRLNRAGVDRAAHDHPGNHRLRVPHLAGPKLIASPDGGRDLRDDVEHARAQSSSVVSRRGLSTASATSAIFPPRQSRIS
jgi:hypothetical protein